MSSDEKTKLGRRIALVTGGAVRIGRAITLELANRGLDVAIHCRRSLGPAEALRAELSERGFQAWVVPGSLDTPEDCEALWRDCKALAGRVDVLINNASIFDRMALVDTDAAEFERQWRVNTLAPIWLTRLLARDRRTSGPDGPIATGGAQPPRASIVNLLDRRIALPEAGSLAYLTSKCALHAFTLSAALELAPWIAVNAVAPGAVLAPPGQTTLAEGAGRAPLLETCRPEDVARAVGFLISQNCITGQVLFVDAGQHLWSV